MPKVLMIIAALALALGLAACGGDGDGSADSGDFCGLADSFSNFEDSTAEVFSNGGADSEELRETWEMVSASFRDFRDAAPPEIEKDVATLTDIVDELTAILEEVDYSITTLITRAATDPSITERLEAFEGDDVEQATARVEKYVSDECGVELS